MLMVLFPAQVGVFLCKDPPVGLEDNPLPGSGVRLCHHKSHWLVTPGVSSHHDLVKANTLFQLSCSGRARPFFIMDSGP